MVTISTSEGPLEVPDDAVKAVRELACRHADMVTQYLIDGGYVPSRHAGGEPPGWMKSYLMELASVLQLDSWERAGLGDYLPVDLPTFGEAAQGLAGRSLKGPSEFEGPHAVPLSLCLLRVWMERFAWDAPEYLEADILLGEVDEDDFVDVLARFLWERRQEMVHLFSEEDREP